MLPAAAAIELIHTYSLIHDDLPAMDDDELRRGCPTSHVKFGEDVAILAGDGLFAEAMRLFTERQEGEPAAVLAALARACRGATGVGGMVGGQYVDVTESRRPSAATVDRAPARDARAEDRAADRRERRRRPDSRRGRPKLRQFPTGASPMSWASCSRSSTTSSTSPARDEELGKPSGTDERHGKLTYVSVFGLERARELAAESHRQGPRGARRGGRRETDDLERITDFIHTRHA